MNADDWRVPPVAAASVTLVSGRDFVISAPDGDIVRGAVHGLLHADRRFLDRFAIWLPGLELRPLASTTPTPFSAVFVARVHESDGRPLPLLVIRRRSVGHGMREIVELHNSGRHHHRVEVEVEVGADFGHLFDVKAGAPSESHGIVSRIDHGVVVESRTVAARFRTVLTADPRPTANHRAGWSWLLDVPAHGSVRAIVDVDAVVAPDDDDLGDLDDVGDAGRGTARRDVDEVSLHRFTSWQQRAPKVVSPDPRLAVSVRRSLDDLSSLRIFDTGHPDHVVVAAGAPWFMALFGRDSLLTAYMALPFAPDLARGVLFELAELQGRTHDPATGEQPGKILHELRAPGGGGPFAAHTRYYGTVDATPLYVVLAAEATRWGAVSPAEHPWLMPAVDAALGWIRTDGDSDGDGFVDYAPHDPHGLANQGWKDSWDGVNAADGSMPRPPIALVEVQGYVDAALRGAAELYTGLGRHDDARRCRDESSALRDRFEASFWDERGWYVQALDGHGRPVDSLGSNPGHVLWTGTADPERANRYLDTVSGAEMWTGWGVRTLATGMQAYDPLSYHNGSVWPHDTAICLAGAARYGRWDVVDLITDGLLDAAIQLGGRLPELFSGVGRDLVPVPVSYPGSCSPQAWAAASVLLLLRANLGLDVDVSSGTLTLQPGGRLVAGLRCDGLFAGGREFSVRIRDGHVNVHAAGFDVRVLPAASPSPVRRRQ